MLARLLLGDIPSLRDPSGAIFIDRDGALFAHVLGWLRTRSRAALPTAHDTLRALAVEADYFQVAILSAAIAQLLPPPVEDGGVACPDAASARARAAAAGPDGVLDAALCADGGRLLAALELLVGLAYSPTTTGAPPPSLAGGGGADVECALRGRGACHQRRPGAFDSFVEECVARGPAGSLRYERELEPLFDAPLLFGGGYDRTAYARPPPGAPPDAPPVWPPALADRNLAVFTVLAAAPLTNAEHDAIKDAVLAVASAPELATLLLRRRFGFGHGTDVRGSCDPAVTWRPSCTYGTSDVFKVTCASVRMTLKF